MVEHDLMLLLLVQPAHEASQNWKCNGEVYRALKWTGKTLSESQQDVDALERLYDLNMPRFRTAIIIQSLSTGCSILRVPLLRVI